MKEITMFMFEGCPHCAKADEIIEAVTRKNPDYANVSIVRIDEKKNPKIADEYDYYYVPSFFVNGVKLHEGAVNEDIILSVFSAASQEK